MEFQFVCPICQQKINKKKINKETKGGLLDGTEQEDSASPQKQTSESFDFNKKIKRLNPPF